MSRVTMTVGHPLVTHPALRQATLALGRLLAVIALGGLGTVILLYATGLAPVIAKHGLLALVGVPLGVWLGWVVRSLVWLLVGQGVGLRLAWLYLGCGPFVTSLVRPRRVIVLRMIPLSVRPALIATQRPALKLQYWLTAVWALVGMTGTAMVLLRKVPPPWGQTIAAGVALAVLVALWPYRQGVTDLWILGRLPFLTERETRALVTDQDMLELALAEEAGDRGRARTALGRLEARGADDGPLSHWRSIVLEMDGRYAEALHEQRRALRTLPEDSDARPWQLANVADLLLAAGEAGQLPVFEWQPATEAALAEAARSLPETRIAGTRAYYCVLTGDYRRGARLARAGIRTAGSRTEAAHGWCALAVAKAGSWDSAGAAEALRRARALAPTCPRVDHAEERVHRLMPTPVS